MQLDNQTVLDELKEVPEWLDCPICGRETKALKEYHILDELFVMWIFFWVYKFQASDWVACPSCMRKILLKRLAKTIISANLAWPIIALPHYTFFLIGTLTSGHSLSIQKVFHDAYQLALQRKKWAEEDAHPEN